MSCHGDVEKREGIANCKTERKLAKMTTMLAAALMKQKNSCGAVDLSALDFFCQSRKSAGVTRNFDNGIIFFSFGASIYSSANAPIIIAIKLFL